MHQLFERLNDTGYHLQSTEYHAGWEMLRILVLNLSDRFHVSILQSEELRLKQLRK